MWMWITIRLIGRLIIKVVTPAEAGAQDVNEQKPPLAAFDFKKLIAGGSRPCTLGSISFVRPKEMDERKGRPDGALLLASAALGPDAGTRDILSRVPVAHIPMRYPFGAPAQSLAVLGCAIRVLKTSFFHVPYLTHNAESTNMVGIISPPRFSPRTMHHNILE